MSNYLYSKTLLRASCLSEIRIFKEEIIQKQLELYQSELDEALRVALEEFRAANAALAVVNAETPDMTNETTSTEVTNSETTPIVSEEIFIENFTKLNQEKFDTLKTDLFKKLEIEMRGLSLERLSVLYNVYSKNFDQERFKNSFFGFSELVKQNDSLLNFVLLEEERMECSIKFFFNNLPVNPFVDPTIVLFLLRLNYSMTKILEKSRKVRFKKFKLKRRKLRKLYVLKKLKRTIVFRKIKKKTFRTRAFFNYSYFNIEEVSSNVLVKRMPVSKRVIENTSVEFFYKLNKKKNRNVIEDFDLIDEERPDLFIYLRNYHQKPYNKLRRARVTHWNLFFNKTIRKQRYKSFINRFVKKPNKLSYSLAYFANVFTRLKFSWTRINKLESFFKLYIVEYSKNILRIPMLFTNFFKWKILKRRSFFLRKKMGRWSYLNFRRATCPWLQRKKNTPKINYHIQPNMFYFHAISYWDFMTGFLYLEEDVRRDCVPPFDQFKTNLLVKLHMYRYKANNKCISH